MWPHGEGNRLLQAKRPHLADIRGRNRALLLRTLARRGAMSRQELADRTGLTNASVSRISRELIEEGFCCEEDTSRKGRRLGRRGTELRIKPDGRLVIAVSLSAFSKRVALTDLLGNTLHAAEIPPRFAESAAAAVEFAGGFIDDAVAAHGVARQRILGAAVAVAGLVNRPEGRLVRAPLLDWRDFPLQRRLAERLSCPVRVENVADALCLSSLGVTRLQSQARIFLVHVAVGMGASLALDGQIVNRGGDEGWIGKIPIRDPDGSGEILTLDQVASGRAILDRAGAADPDGVSGKTDIARRLAAAVRASNRESGPERRRFREAGTILGETLMLLTAAYLPETIVLAGPVSESEAFCNGVIDAFRRTARDADSASIEFYINRITYLEAAQRLALFTVMTPLARADPP